MKQMICPMNGLRDIAEFAFGGPVKAMPDPATGTDGQWADYLFLDDNIAGVVREWWLHVPSGYWFVAERDTVTDDVLRTFDPGELFDARVEFGAPE